VYVAGMVMASGQCRLYVHELYILCLEIITSEGCGKLEMTEDDDV